MCKWGTEVLMEVAIPAHLSHTGGARRDVKGIDACIAPIVAALNAAGIETWQSRCGHGKNPGLITLADGRVLRIATNPAFEELLDELGKLPVGSAIEEACEIIEMGDRRRLASDGPAGNRPPDLTLKEWRRLYVLLAKARVDAASITKSTAPWL